MEYYDNDYLMHYGVKGMKWGVRKQQVSIGNGLSLKRNENCK